jgi:hypothetical protein
MVGGGHAGISKLPQVAPLVGRAERAAQGPSLLVFTVPADPAKVSGRSKSRTRRCISFTTLRWSVTKLDGERGGDLGADAVKGRKWSRRTIGEGNPGEIKVGRASGKRYIAAVEPWHGQSVVLYEEASPLLKAHGNRVGPGRGARPRLGRFRRRRERGVSGRMAREALGPVVVPSQRRVVDEDTDRRRRGRGGPRRGDLNGDGRPEIIAGGRATQNIRIYWVERL